MEIDVAAMQQQKASAVDGLTKGIEGLFKKNKVSRAVVKQGDVLEVVQQLHSLTKGIRGLFKKYKVRPVRRAFVRVLANSRQPWQQVLYIAALAGGSSIEAGSRGRCAGCCAWPLCRLLCLAAVPQQALNRHTLTPRFASTSLPQVEYVQGWGKIKAAGQVEVATAAGGTTTLSAKNIIIATGSEVTPLPGVPVDEKR